MATKLALEYQRNKEDKRHNIVSENLGAGNLAVGAVNAGSSAIKSIANVIGSIAALAAGNPEMYRHNDNAIEVVAQKAYFNKKGQPVTFETELIDSGIVVADIIPTIGTMPNTKYNTPFQAMFQQIFAVIRGKNSGATNYDYVDLGQATLGLDSMRMIYEDIWRALDLALFCDNHNSYTISTLVKALGYDINFLNTNRTAIISILNKFAIDMSPVLLPGNIDYVKRHANLAGVVFVDNEGFKRNYYAYSCQGYFKYDEINSALVWNGNVSWKNNLGALEQVLTDLKNAYLFSEAISIMSGDVGRAIDNGALSINSVFKFPVINLDYGGVYHKDLFCMNELDLSSFRNMRIFSIEGVDQAKQYSIRQYADAQTGTFFIYQGERNASNAAAGVMVANPVDSDGPTQGSATPSLFARTDYDTPSTDSIIEDTRLLVPYDSDTFPAPNQKLMPIGTHCSEICVGLHVWAFTTTSNWNNNNASDYFVDCTNFQDPNVQVSWIQKLFNNIPYLPAILVYHGDGANYTQYFTSYYNATVYDKKMLQEMNELAMRSLLFFDPKGSAEDNYSRRNATDNTQSNGYGDPKGDTKSNKKNKHRRRKGKRSKSDKKDGENGTNEKK